MKARIIKSRQEVVYFFHSKERHIWRYCRGVWNYAFKYSFKPSFESKERFNWQNPIGTPDKETLILANWKSLSEEELNKVMLSFPIEPQPF